MNKKRICLILISIYQNLSRGHLMYANVAGINHFEILKEIFKILKIPQLLDEILIFQSRKNSLISFLFSIIVVHRIIQ